jgi:hypothetical protein
MVKLSLGLALLSLVTDVEAFSSIAGFSRNNLPSLSFTRQPKNTRLRAVLEYDFDAEEMIPLGGECILTPEGFGFSSSTSRIIQVANRQNGFYRAMASDIVTDVMEGITEGQVDVALVFDDSSGKLLGIFTETDYIKV